MTIRLDRTLLLWTFVYYIPVVWSQYYGHNGYCKGDSRKLWRTLSSIMGNTKTANNSSGHTADEFAAFFAEKVDSVRQSTSSTPLPHVPATAKQELREWEPVTSEDVAKLISEAPSKSCQLDTAPTWLVKQCNGLLAPFIALLFNKSLSTGCFPTNFKHAVVTPLLKKTAVTIVS